MGRGRAKAKQTKVARELKYHTGSLDTTALARDLGSTPVTRPTPVHVDDDEPEYVDRWATDDEDDGPVAAAR